MVDPPQNQAATSRLQGNLYGLACWRCVDGLGSIDQQPADRGGDQHGGDDIERWIPLRSSQNTRFLTRLSEISKKRLRSHRSESADAIHQTKQRADVLTTDFNCTGPPIRNRQAGTKN